MVVKVSDLPKLFCRLSTRTWRTFSSSSYFTIYFHGQINKKKNHFDKRKISARIEWGKIDTRPCPASTFYVSIFMLGMMLINKMTNFFLQTDKRYQRFLFRARSRYRKGICCRTESAKKKRLQNNDNIKTFSLIVDGWSILWVLTGFPHKSARYLSASHSSHIIYLKTCKTFYELFFMASTEKNRWKILPAESGGNERLWRKVWQCFSNVVWFTTAD